jgi:hypothetical protein
MAELIAADVNPRHLETFAPTDVGGYVDFGASSSPHKAHSRRAGSDRRADRSFNQVSSACLAAELLQREKTTGLTPDERRELDHYEDLELLMNLARARARASCWRRSI